MTKGSCSKELPELVTSVKECIESILDGSESFHRRTSSLPDSEFEMVPLADSNILVQKKTKIKILPEAKKTRMGIFAQELAVLVFSKETLKESTLTGKSRPGDPSKKQLEKEKEDRRSAASTPWGEETAERASESREGRKDVEGEEGERDKPVSIPSPKSICEPHERSCRFCLGRSGAGTARHASEGSLLKESLPGAENTQRHALAMRAAGSLESRLSVLRSQTNNT
ncbi:hypothetical protein PDJAM_G00110860 [Pangasius djambal]|uniref:Uncharacterized protein n=1 Tax=Pangasius djambal TaxID=1691987 RepID=A0ACC5Y242_9TELE|nr:hypothetical protein [Pangasius djambal]